MLTFTALALASTALLCGTTTEAKSIPRRNLPWNSNPLKAKTALLSRNTIPESFINATRDDPSTVALHIDTSDLSARNDTAPYLYGLMHEDINHSGDGGIYGELLTNRAFQGSNVVYGTLPEFSGSLIVGSENPIVPWDPVITGWGAIGDGVRLTLDKLHPSSDALTTALQVDIPSNATGEVGIQNFGWWGIDVRPQQYNASFYASQNYPRNPNDTATTFTLSSRSNLTGEVFASTQIPDTHSPYINYTQYSAHLYPNVTAPDSNNTFAITMDGAANAGKTFYFDLVSLFGETFKNRPNGLRKDIAEAFYEMKPTFLRCPGGNNLEGVSPQTRWDWKKTIGPLINRPGRPGDWSYENTLGSGLMEYLEWCEDMEIEPVLAVYSGFSLDVYGQSGPSYPPDQMQEIVDDASNELEFCMGDTSTYWGSLRAQYGHPEPFNIKFVEIGNEDWFSTTYPYRWAAMYNGLKAVYPNITYISTAYNENTLYNISIPAGEMWDTHHYEEPSYFLENFDFYDNWQEATNNTGVGVLLGEYSAIQIDTYSGVVNYSFPADVHIFYPSLVSAIAEGTYALGAERNPNTVKMSSYAPSLQSQNWFNWTPDMITFDANWNHTVRSVSYWQQWLFAHYRGTQTSPVTNTQGDFNPLFWVASIDVPKNQIYLKVINTSNASVPSSVDITTTCSGVNGTMITADSSDAHNTIENPNAVTPKSFTLDANQSGNGTFSWDVPKWSITVSQFDS